jgi:hypothetical protein
MMEDVSIGLKILTLFYAFLGFSLGVLTGRFFALTNRMSPKELHYLRCALLIVAGPSLFLGRYLVVHGCGKQVFIGGIIMLAGWVLSFLVHRTNGEL